MTSRTSRIKGAIGALLALWLGMGIASQAFADAAFEGEKTTDKLKFGGDIRLRFDDIMNKSLNQVDRARERFRIRFGVTGTLQDITAGFRLASGTGEQTSTNQSMTNMANQKGVYIDQAYLSWKVHEYLKISGGKMVNPFWMTYASDMMWDADVNPEGFAEQVELPAGDRVSLFANLAQLPLQEVSGATNDPWAFGQQVGASVKLTEDTKLKFGVSYYGFINENKQTLISTQVVDSANIQEANTRVSGSARLASKYKLTLYTLQLDSHLLDIPASLQADFIRNIARGNSNSSTNPNYTPGQNTGYQLGAILGKAKNAKTWELAYFYKWLEANASLSDWADSDFGNGGTNRRGHIMWLAYAPRDYVQLKVKYFVTRKLDTFISSSAPYGPVASPSYADLNRVQFDVAVKF